MMELGTLDQTHPSYDPEHWGELEALVKGGKRFKSLLSRFLPQNPVEPSDVYAQRRQQAHYTSHVGSIINLYGSWLFASSFSVKAYKRGTETPIESVDPFYGVFQEDVGGEVQIGAFMKARFVEALATHRAYWLIELPSNDGLPPEDAAEYEARGLGRATLKALDLHEVLDWEEDGTGTLNWVAVRTCYDVRRSWQHARNQTVETWRIYDREYVYTYQLEYEKGKRPTDPKTLVPQLGEPAPHGFKRVPIVRLHIPKAICIGEQARDAQVEHFRLDNALSWLIRRTCYAQPVFHLEDGESPPRMGAGYAIVLGKDDKMGWTSPPTAPFDVLKQNVEIKRDEVYRVTHTMAQSVDNNAETVGRSADSKEIDAAATRIMLNTYGAFVSQAIEETYELISEARDELDYEWSVEGFSGYDTTTASKLIANSQAARELGIPSKTFHKELCTKVALALHPEADQRIKDTIRQEISQADFVVTSTPSGSAQDEALRAQAKLAEAKAKAEPIKAKAAVKSAERPQTPTAPSGTKPKPSAAPQ